MFKKLLESLQTVNVAPLHHRLRPKTINEYVGHHHLRGQKKIMESILESHHIPPLFLLGPPGIGKTTFARLIGKKVGYRYVEFNAIHKSWGTIRNAVFESCRIFKSTGQRTIFFLDEIDRVPAPEQSIFLPHMEKGGAISLIAATPRDPKKILHPELLKKFAFLVLKKHTMIDLRVILERALKDEELGYGKRKITMDEASKKYLCQISEGNAREMLRMLSRAVILYMLKGAPAGLKLKQGCSIVINQSLLDTILKHRKKPPESTVK